MGVTVEKATVSTREKILDAAEVLLIEKGFAATSLRAIANLADVNLAATNYHFGSKEGLLAATIHRRIEPINQARLTNLDQLELKENYLVPAIIDAFFDPLVDEKVDPAFSRLFARLHGEPATISRPLLEKEFGIVGARYLAALSKALPTVDAEELRWRMHLMIGSMIHLLNFPSPLRTEPTNSRQEGIEKLKSFAIAGLIQLNLPGTESNAEKKEESL